MTMTELDYSLVAVSLCRRILSSAFVRSGKVL